MPYLFYFSQTKRCKIGHKLSYHRVVVVVVGYLYTSIFLYIGPWESQNSACTQIGIQFKYTY